MATTSFSFNLPKDPQAAFKEGWKKWVEQTAAGNLYWKADSSEWWFAGPTPVQQLPFPPVALVFGWPEMIWTNLESSWKSVRAEHPHAIWSPHNGLWYDVSSGSSTTNKWGPGEEALAAELLRIDELYNRHKIDAPERLRLREKAFDNYSRRG